MIEFDGMQLDGNVIVGPVELFTDLPERKSYDFAMKRRSFYKRHELAIWAGIVSIGCVGLYMLFRNNSDLAWRLSTPLMRYVP